MDSALCMLVVAYLIADYFIARPAGWEWLRGYRVEVCLGLAAVAAIHALTWVRAFDQPIEYAVVGQYGDFVGGYFGTIFTMFSVFLLYRTFQSQRELSKTTTFETKFYELLKLHRENVTEMSIGAVVGRRIFVTMLAELREVFKIVLLCEDQESRWTTEERWHIAYYFFYFGVGPKSTPMVMRALADYEIYRIENIERILRDRAKEVEDLAAMGIEYQAFDGHQSRLGHYYRHLYQAIAFIDHEKTLLPEQKYPYAKMLRAQLSTHEQALLLINSLTPFGNKWWDEKLINVYRLTKNIPPQFFTNEEIDIGLYFEGAYFEVDELQKRPKSRVLQSW